MKLKTHSEFARQIGCSQQAISRACQEGGHLHPAVADGRRIDVEHAAAIEYADAKEHGRRVRRMQAKPKPKPKPKPKKKPEPVADVITSPEAALEEYKSGSADIRDMTNKTLDEIKSLFTTAAEFREWIKSIHELEKIHAQRIKNWAAEGLLVSRLLVKQGIIGPIEELFARLLTDASKTIAIKNHAMALAGRTVAECETETREIIGSFIRPTKERIHRALGKLKGK
jgi:hypothetical protein